MKKALKITWMLLLIAIVAVGGILTGIFIATKYKGPRITPVTDDEANRNVCLYEQAQGKEYIDSEINRLLGYRDQGIEEYFSGLTHEEVADYVEANLHTLIKTLEDKGYSHDALKKAQAVYIYYNLGMIGWDYTGVYSRDIDTVTGVVDKDGNFLFDPAYWREVCYKSGV